MNFEFKKMNHFKASMLSLLLVFAMVVSAFGMMIPEKGYAEESTGATMSGNAEILGTIVESEWKTVNIIVADDIAFFKFVPGKTGTYIYRSRSAAGVDPYGLIYDSTRMEIDRCDDILGNDFVMETELIAGQTYYLAAKVVPGKTGYYSVMIEAQDSSVSGDAVSIIPNKDTVVKIIGGQATEVVYVPEIDGTYVLTSYSNEDTHCKLYDAEGNLLADADDIEDGNYNFALEYELTAGQEYHYMVAYWANEDTDPIKVRLTCSSDKEHYYCLHEETEIDGELEADCTTDGFTGNLICSECEKILEPGEVIPAGHQYGAYVTVQKATCTLNKISEKTCSVCGDVYRKEAEGTALGHTGGTASCSSKAICTRCNKAYGDYDKSVHLASRFTGKTAATCVSAGNTGFYVCTACGIITKSGTKIPALGHTGGTATCTVKATCTRCLAKYGSLDPDYHKTTKLYDVKAATCTEDGYTGDKKCTACLKVLKKGTVVEATGHTEVTTTKKATLTANGKITVKCSTCDEILKTTTIYRPGTIELDEDQFVYDGKAKTPVLTVLDTRGKAISSTNYTVVKDSGRKYVGTYTYTITFKNKYKGTDTVSFVIVPKPTTLSSVTAGTGKITVKWTALTTQTTGYQIQYSTSSTFATGTKTVNVTKNTTTGKSISNLTKGKKYYVRIRTYKTVDGENYYSSWSAKKYATVK